VFRALVVSGLLACTVLFVGYVAASSGLDGPCAYDFSLPEGSSVSTDVAAWPPGAVKCVTEFSGGRVRTETFPRDGYWVAALAVGLVPLALWAMWFRGRSVADWTEPWQRRVLAAAEVAFTLIAAAFTAFALLFFLLLWMVPPMGPICAALAWVFWRWARELRVPLLTSDAGPPAA
jgi:hypothetical protein